MRGLNWVYFPQSEKISVISKFDNPTNNWHFKVQLGFTFHEAIKCLKNGVYGHWEFQKMGAKEANLF